VSAPGWATRFPRIFELYGASAQGEPGNYFEFKNVRRGLAAGEPFFVRLEQILAALDPIAWQTFKTRTAPYVHKLDAWEYSRQLFERFHEAEGYLVLREKGYQHVRFLPEDTGTPQPDLEATDRGSLVLMEVKTVNESDDQKRYFEAPLEFLPIRQDIPAGLEAKIRATITHAQTQLQSVQSPTIQRRLILLFIRLDFHVEAAGHLNDFLRLQELPGVEIWWRLLKP
jgi:hypothetical protein